MPVDRSTLDRAPAAKRIAGPPAPKPRVIAGPPAPPPGVVAGGGGDFKKPYVPAVPAHDRAPLRDARVAARTPYVSVIGHPGQRSTMPPEDQLHFTKQLQGGKLTPQQSNNLSRYLASLPHPADQLHLIGTAQQEGVLPPAAVTIALGAAHKITESVKGLPLGEKKNVLQSFPQLDQPTDPGIIQELRDAATARGVKLPANPTLSDLYQGKYGPKPDGWVGLYRNLPRDFLMTPVYAAQGGFALGGAVTKAALHGDTRDLQEIGAQQLDILKHPKDFITQHPAQAALMLIGGAKAGGRAAAVGRDLEATPRAVPLLDPETRLPLPEVGGEVPTLNRGTLSTRNLTTRGAQKLSDAILGRHPTLQARQIRATFRDSLAETKAQGAADTAPAIKQFQEARKGVTRQQANRVIENEARGITPQQHAGFRSGEAPSVGEQMTSAEGRFHDALVNLEQTRVQRIQKMGLLSDQAAAHRAYRPAILVAAKAGDATAQRFLAADEHAAQLQDDLAAAEHPDPHEELAALRAGKPHVPRLDPDVVRSQLQAANEARDVALQTFVARHQAEGLPTPVRVPEVPMKKVQSAFARPAGGGTGIAALKRSVKPPKTHGPYKARLFEAGTYKPITEQDVLAQHAIPSKVEQAYRFAAEVSNPARGLVKHAQPGDVIPDGYVLQKVRDQSNPLADEIQATEGGAAATTPLESLMSTFDLNRINDAARRGEPPIVPNGPGEYRLWPISAYEQLQKMGKTLNPSDAKAAKLAGRVLRNSLLYSRPAYPITNVISNIAQSGLVAGTGVPSYVRAKGFEDDLLPARVQGTGAAAVNFDAPGASSLRNAWADRNTTIGGVGRVAVHPFARYMQGVYKVSSDLENWTRKATYLSKAIPEAQRLAHPEWGPVSRFVASWKPADAAVKQVLDDMAHGRTEEARAAAQRSVKVLNQALGDFSAMPSNRALDIAVPFHRWTQFITKMMAQTLPFHYPGRALLLYRLGSLGQVAQHQLGPLTPSLQGAIPGLGGAFSTQRVNPWSTLGMNVMPAQGQTALDPTRSISNFSPWAQMAYEVLAHKDPVTGTELTNRLGLPVQGTDYLRLAGAQAVGFFPPARALAPLFGGGRPNSPSTSIDLPGLVQQGPRRVGPQQPSPPGWLNALNQVSPVSFRKVDLPLMAKQGSKKLHSNLRHAATVTRKDAIEHLAASIAHQQGVDTSDRNTAAFQRVLQQAIDQYERSHH